VKLIGGAEIDFEIFTSTKSPQVGHLTDLLLVLEF